MYFIPYEEITLHKRLKHETRNFNGTCIVDDGYCKQGSIQPNIYSFVFLFHVSKIKNVVTVPHHRLQ
jgi:hypothetical protein